MDWVAVDLVALQGLLDNSSFAILFLTLLVYWVGAAFPQIPGLATIGTGGMAIANLCIAALLSARWIEAGYFPLSNLYESLFFLAWGITAIHLVAEQMSRSRLVGTVTAPVATAISAFAALSLPGHMQVSEPLVPALKSNWLMMHVSVMLLSYATLLVGALLAIAFLIVTWGQPVELRGSSVGTGGFRKGRYTLQRSEGQRSEGQRSEGQRSEGQRSEGQRSGADVAEVASVATVVQGSGSGSGSSTAAVLDRVDTVPTVAAPTLSPQRLTLADVLDNISYRMIGLGFPLLTIGIIAGAVWANEAWGSYWSWDPKETWALITWLVFAAYLHARITKGWQGRRPAILAASGFVVVWVCYLGVNILGKGLHSYGWFF